MVESELAAVCRMEVTVCLKRRSLPFFQMSVMGITTAYLGTLALDRILLRTSSWKRSSAYTGRQVQYEDSVLRSPNLCSAYARLMPIIAPVSRDG